MVEKVQVKWKNERDRLEWVEKDARARAKLKLRYYLGLALLVPIDDLSEGARDEIDSIVDDIVDAAIAGAKRQRLEEGR